MPVETSIGLFGGTFNPIHYGHLRAAEELRDVFPLSKVVFIPSNNPPLKRDALAPSRHRYEMARLAVSRNSGFALSDIECKSDGVSYTVNTIGQMTRQYAGSALYFIMGLDAFLEMPKWFKAEEILANAALIVMARPPLEMERIKESPYIDGHNCRIDGKVAQMGLRNGKYLSVASITPHNISSTQIRQSIREGRTIKYLLPESVESYIMNNELYK
ncbi:nicotinate-nucleotide adenylyltransferase [Candidatus Magnetominusculus dajiuhuensis]|uniref:nicotinate-nucleotide adenylyltransferase n=1 Tax=Candidatus Magnetominusculus dajiuhuensis TaxID=3137712 RepID=UPI003B4365D7